MDLQNPIRLGLSRVRELAQLAVLERGAEFVYQRPEIDGQPTCAYFDNFGKPSCLVGMILFRCGIEPLHYTTLNSVWVFDLQDEGVIEADPDAIAYLDDLQSAQDKNVPWGEAVENAEQKHRARYSGSYKEAIA